MDRARTRQDLGVAPVRADRARALELLLRAGHRVAGESRADAAARRAIHAHALLRRAQDDGLAAGAGLRGQPQAGLTADAADGARGDLSQASALAAGSRASRVPVFAQESGNHKTRSGL